MVPISSGTADDLPNTGEGKENWGGLGEIGGYSYLCEGAKGLALSCDSGDVGRRRRAGCADNGGGAGGMRRMGG